MLSTTSNLTPAALRRYIEAGKCTFGIVFFMTFDISKILFSFSGRQEENDALTTYVKHMIELFPETQARRMIKQLAIMCEPNDVLMRQVGSASF
jgi:hypothetical protein